MMLIGGVPAERRTTPEVGVLPAARLRRAVPTRGRRSLACASRCRWVVPRRRGHALAPASVRAVRVSPTALNHGDGLGNADLRPVLSVGPAPLREAQRKASVWMMLKAGVPAERRTTPEVGVLPAARLRRAVPTRGRRSRACASPSPWGYPPRWVARRLRADHRASPTAQNRGDGGAPVSDRHRAGARNPHR